MDDIINVSLAGSVGITTVCFLIYWFWAHSTSFKWFLKVFSPFPITEKYAAFFQKGLGILLIGLIPGLVILVFRSYFKGDYGLILDDVPSSLWWILCLGWLMVLIPYFSARKREMQAFYPQIRIPYWSKRLLLINMLVWSVYLFAYEFLFRSFLLNSLLISLDTTSAVVVTTAISGITHMPKGAAETFGTIPFSIVLCLAMIYTGSIWAGFAIHLVLALSNDFWALHFNPKMGLKKEELSLTEH